MRNWQRMAIACTRSPVVSAMLRRNVIVGPAAYGSDRAPRQSKTSSGMAVREGAGALAHAPEELVDVLACLRTAVETRPVQPQSPDELVADVDRHEVGLIR